MFDNRLSCRTYRISCEEEDNSEHVVLLMQWNMPGKLMNSTRRDKFCVSIALSVDCQSHFDLMYILDCIMLRCPSLPRVADATGAMTWPKLQKLLELLSSVVYARLGSVLPVNSQGAMLASERVPLTSA